VLSAADAAPKSGVQVGVCQGLFIAEPGVDERNKAGAAKTAAEPVADPPAGGIWAADCWACESSAAGVAGASKAATGLVFIAR
jgi:hypothetical protein